MRFPEGYMLRRPRPDDAAVIAALMTTVDVDAGEDVTASDVEREWHGLDLENDVWVLDAPGRRVAAYLETLKRSDERVVADGYVHPNHARHGVGRALLDLSERHARRLLQGPGTVSSWTLSGNLAAVRLFESRGYRPTRRFFRMVIDLDAEPSEPRWPDGLEPRAFVLAHARKFHAAHEEAFADEYGHEPQTFDEWREQRLHAPFSDHDLWLGVWHGDEIAATLICDAERFGMGWIAAVGVRERWRHRGVGLALLQHAFTEFWRRGRRRVGLGVDAQNATGATRLYERAGMRVLYAAVNYEKELASATSVRVRRSWRRVPKPVPTSTPSSASTCNRGVDRQV